MTDDDAIPIIQDEQPDAVEESTDGDAQFANLAYRFVMHFYLLLKSAVLYASNNVMLHERISLCLAAMRGIFDLQGALSLRIVQNSCYINTRRIQPRSRDYPNYRAFIQEMQKRRIGAVDFTAGVTEEHLEYFAYLWAGLEDRNENNALIVKHRLEARGIDTIEVEALEAYTDAEVLVKFADRLERAREIYARLIMLAKNAVQSVRETRTLHLRMAKRVMQQAIKTITEDEAAILGLAAIRDQEESTFNHAVNVAIYAVAIGRRIDIPAKQLCELGLAGLLHDIGKTVLRAGILEKSGKLTPSDWEEIQTHPIRGARLFLDAEAWGELTSRMMLVTFEHHLQYREGGYPPLLRPRQPSVFSRIITIADCYDTLGRPRGAGQLPYVTEKSWGFMLEHSGRYFDPTLVKVFIQALGLYPVGAFVQLDNEELGVVVQANDDGALLDRPQIRLLVLTDGGYEEGDIVDLQAVDETSGEFLRTIVKTLNPNDYRQNVLNTLA